MAVSIVQFKGLAGNFVPATIVLDSAPTPGNLIIAAYGGFINDPFNNTAWTNLEINTAGGGMNFRMAYRYVQPGDTATLPNLCSTSGGAFEAFAYEIAGVTGVIADDVFDSSAANSTNGTGSHTLSPASITGTGAGQIALGFFFAQNGNNNPTDSNGFTDDRSNGPGAWMSTWAGNKAVSGDPVDLTVSYSTAPGTADQEVFLAVLGLAGGPGPGPEPKRRRSVMVLQ